MQQTEQFRFDAAEPQPQARPTSGDRHDRPPVAVPAADRPVRSQEPDVRAACQLKPDVPHVPLPYRELVSRCLALAGELGASQLGEEALGAIGAAFAPMSVAVIGEQAAKTSVLNALLGVDALDTVCGHGRLRRVVAGETEGISRGLGVMPELPLTGRGWEQVDAQPPGIEVCVTVDSPTLHALRVELVDFPMSRELAPGGAEWRSLQLCHVAVMIVDASSMVTRREAEVLGSLLRSGGPPCVSVAVGGLTSVAVKERDSVLAAIEHVIRRNAPAAKFVVGEQPISTAAGLERVLAGITEEERVRGSRAWQLETILRCLVLDLRTVAEDSMRTCALADRRIADAARTLDAEEARALDALAEVRVRLFERGAAGFARLRHSGTAGLRSEDEHRLLEQLHATGDAAAWWTEDLPEAVDSLLSKAAVEIEEHVGQVIGEQLAWLGDDLARTGVDIRSRMEPPPAAALELPTLLLPQDRAQRLRAITRLSTPILQLLGPVLGIVLGAPISGLERLPDTFFSPHIAADHARAQRELGTHLAAAMRRLYDRGEAQLEAALAEVVSSVRADVRHGYEVRRSALRASGASEHATREVLSRLNEAMNTIITPRSTP
jgi:hypothetical protein